MENETTEAIVVIDNPDRITVDAIVKTVALAIIGVTANRAANYAFERVKRHREAKKLATITAVEA